jgi:D-glycero-alpha-D-manno-heptose-7-phosphate kinase
MKDVKVVARVPVRIDFAGGWTDVKPYSDRRQGWVLNATIDRFIVGSLTRKSTPPYISVAYSSPVPTGSGLGTSSAMNVLYLGLLNPDKAHNPALLAETAYQFETLLGIKGGKQDQYAAAFGGFNLMRFYRGTVEVERITPPEAFVRELESKMTLCFTGESRLSSEVHSRVWDGITSGHVHLTQCFDEMARIARRMAFLFKHGDMDGIVELIGTHNISQSVVSPFSPDGRIGKADRIAQLAGTTCGKVCGAGGGGCVFFISKTVRDRNALRKRLLESNNGFQVIPFHFTEKGFHIVD